MKGSTLPAPKEDSASGVPVETRIKKGQRLARSGIFQMIINADIAGCCNEAESLVAECRQTNSQETCVAAMKAVGLCMHYQENSYGV